MSLRFIMLAGLLAVSVSSGFAQTKQDIGDFDIEKVKKSAASEQMSLPDTAQKAASAEAVTTESWGVVIFRICGYLALIIAMIFGVFFVMKKAGVRGAPARAAAASMDLLETLTLGSGRSLILVRVMDTVLVLSQTAQNTVLIDKLEGQKALDAISATRGSGSITQFKDLFGTFLSKMKKTA